MQGLGREAGLNDARLVLSGFRRDLRLSLLSMPGCARPGMPRFPIRKEIVMKPRPLILAAALALPAAAALADARIEYRATEGGGSSMQAMLIGHGKLRTDADAETSVILDPGTDTMIVLNHGEREYMRMGRAEMKQMAETVNQAMAQMEAALANVPPEMREQMKGMIGGAIPGAGGEAMVSMADTGERDTVAGHDCRIYRTQLQGKTVNEACMGSTSVLSELSAADRQTLERALAMTQSMVEQLATGPMAQFVDMAPFKAGLVPLRVTDVEGGRRSTSEFAGVDDAPLPADLFAIPSGYREQKLEMPDFGR